MPYKDPAKRREQWIRWRKANPEKRREINKRSAAKCKYMPSPAAKLKQSVRWKVSQEIRMGRLVRGPCEICGDSKGQAHHDDYSRPLDVRWLCRLHHIQHHATQHA